ncbi:hypothetical protein F4677DRAFT_407932 [Hypoxylon crocopeplum]|nr:hypothetical protein F4677DRAFT_407932 [Hypoxylon crocopeplum]
MPPGSRQVHTKTRNGCGQCKRRRVRCNLEPPVCSNCQRRKETCDYSLGHFTIPLPSAKPTTSTSPHLLTGPTRAKSSLTPIRHGRTAAFRHDSGDTLLSQRAFSDVLLSYMEKAYAEPTMPSLELSIWIQELKYHIGQFNYLGPTVKSIQSLFQWFNGGSTSPEFYTSALQYNIEASNRFRLSNFKVTETNWLAMLIFGIGVIIFHFCISLSASDQDFNFLDVFHVLKESARLGRQVGPYFLNSRLGVLVRRQYIFDGPVDEETLIAIRQLDLMKHPKGTSEETKLVYDHTIETLRSWAHMVEGQPQTWRDFFYFPETVLETYFDLLQQKDSVALTIFVYWCAIMHRAPHRWFMDRWACRAADSAMSYLGAEWAGLLEWPRNVLNSPPPSPSLVHSLSPFATRDHFSELVLFPFFHCLWSIDRSD